MKHPLLFALALSPLLSATLVTAAPKPHVTAVAFQPPTLDAATTSAKLEPLRNEKKREFEKTKDFETRMCAAARSALGLAEGQPVAIVTDQKAHYHADEERFALFPGPAFHASATSHDDPNQEIGDWWRWSSGQDPYNLLDVAIGTKMTSGGTQQRRTAYNVPVSVQKVNVQTVELLMPTRGPSNASIIWLKASPAEAPQLKDDLRFAVVGKLAAPCVAFGHGRSPAKLSNPEERVESAVALTVAPQPQWYVYRASSGQVLMQGTLQAAQPGHHR